MLSRVTNKIYYLLTGINAKELKKDNDNFRGIAGALGVLVPEPSIASVLEAFGSVQEQKDCKDLAELLARYGSDKSTKHDYYLIYASTLKDKRSLPLSILEIGLGTNNTSIPSNMGAQGKPGASLRAFRDWGPHFTMYGADVDRNILFKEERISTFFVDQTDTESLAELASHFPPQSLDMVIDDGLHTPWANLNTLNFAMGLIKPGGYLIIEDILDKHLFAWKVALPLVKGDCRLVRCKSATACVVQKL